MSHAVVDCDHPVWKAFNAIGCTVGILKNAINDEFYRQHKNVQTAP